MSKRRLIVIAAVGSVFLLTVIIVVILFAGRKPAPSPPPAVFETSPSASPDEPAEGDARAEAANLAEGEANPILRAVPYRTGYYRLTFDGVENDKYIVRAIIYINDGEDGQAEIEKQKPFIIDYLRRSGQQDGTYTVVYEAQVGEN